MRKLGITLIGACMALFAGLAFAATAAVSWTAPTIYFDGSPAAGLFTYNLYQGAQGGALVKVQSGITGLAATVTTGLTVGTTQCFAVTAIQNGSEGAQGAPACALIPTPVPGVPTQITVVIR